MSEAIAPGTLILDDRAIQRALVRIAHEIAERNENGAEVVLVGIPVGGDHLAARLAKTLAGIWNQPVPVGILDVTMHRDDLDHRMAPTVHPTDIPFNVTGKIVVLGLVTTKFGALESKDTLKRRIDEASKYVSLDQLCLSPQCGFSSTVHGNDIAVEDQRAKLRLVIETAQEVWGSA